MGVEAGLWLSAGGWSWPVFTPAPLSPSDYVILFPLFPLSHHLPTGTTHEQVGQMEKKEHQKWELPHRNIANRFVMISCNGTPHKAGWRRRKEEEEWQTVAWQCLCLWFVMNPNSAEFRIRVLERSTLLRSTVLHRLCWRQQHYRLLRLD